MNNDDMNFLQLLGDAYNVVYVDREQDDFHTRAHHAPVHKRTEGQVATTMHGFEESTATASPIALKRPGVDVFIAATQAPASPALASPTPTPNPSKP